MNFILDLSQRSVILHIFVNWYENKSQCRDYILPKRVAELETGYLYETVRSCLNRVWLDVWKRFYRYGNEEVS